MTREIHFFEAHSCYVVKWIEDLDPRILNEHWSGLVSDPRFKPGFGALHDVRGRKIEFDSRAVSANAREYRVRVEPQVGFGRLAILVDSDEAIESSRRLIAMLELDGSIVTRSEFEAKQWVGLAAEIELYGSP